ncbi:hypothetical protein KDH_79560 [Dictyobacter sp. S3.2.2.5]|uniref:Uncharacterized protein n=1 Tax=Dictyobacter halimunensis TaxID=3026934 RepID=A0ABQ6G771_9CHLR|nr:hypothetical protein KDH_79560 [Dictyobacter sp. S3.2.2.5]
MADELHPQQMSAITKRAEQEADRAIEIATQRLKAAGITPTAGMIEDIVFNVLYPDILHQVNQDIDAGKYDRPEQQQ